MCFNPYCMLKEMIYQDYITTLIQTYRENRFSIQDIWLLNKIWIVELYNLFYFSVTVSAQRVIHKFDKSNALCKKFVKRQFWKKPNKILKNNFRCCDISLFSILTFFNNCMTRNIFMPLESGMNVLLLG